MPHIAIASCKRDVGENGEGKFGARPKISVRTPASGAKSRAHAPKWSLEAAGFAVGGRASGAGAGWGDWDSGSGLFIAGETGTPLGGHRSGRGPAARSRRLTDGSAAA